ncbi:hypothetical protein E2C01_029603 [Portunus trituberculatus]|uniref:Uncharacterized protein n=1 Tax=Portunus trituberculatus TaxID=210409 RepID=A0A5B7ERW4_PORTR|nr:hypothetical protein [Portunus trituberculatus]
MVTDTPPCRVLLSRPTFTLKFPSVLALLPFNVSLSPALIPRPFSSPQPHLNLVSGSRHNGVNIFLCSPLKVQRSFISMQ